MTRTFVGIGFGPIQSGLFLLEAWKAGRFDRLIVAEVVRERVDAVRRSSGCCWVNVAEAEAIRHEKISGLEIYNPLEAGDVLELVEAIASANEVATALPSVEFFTRDSPSPADLLARGLQRKLGSPELPAAVVYAAENHNHAAEVLRDAVALRLDETEHAKLDHRVQFVNTVIGKMSGVVTDPQQMDRNSLMPLVDGGSHAVLVEEFNRILISQITLADIDRGLDVFQEKQNLLPFEEAKLFGHNAAHALMGYLAHRRRFTYVSEVRSDSLLPFVRQAFLEESGSALCRRHAGVDPLFSKSGWAAYVDDLLVRMTNPNLQDRVDRVIRDPRRKLGWDDRLIGTMRLSLNHGVEPQRYAIGAAAAVELQLAQQPGESVADLLTDIWGNSSISSDDHRSIVDRIERARRAL